MLNNAPKFSESNRVCSCSHDAQSLLEHGLTESGFIVGRDFVPGMAFSFKRKKFHVSIGFPRHKVIVQLHRSDSRQLRYLNRQRDVMFSNFGWVAIHFSEKDIATNFHRCMGIILDELCARRR